MQEIVERLPPIVFVLAFAGLWGWEFLAAARTSNAEPGRKRRNLTLSALNFILGGVVATLLVSAATWITARHWGLAALEGPQGLIIALGVLALDLTDYARHRVSHVLPWLWRLHRVHHTDAQVDITTSLRSHPIEPIVRCLFDAAAILSLGIGPLTLAVHAIVQIATLLFQHANVALPPALARRIAWLTPTPDYHLVHHSRRRKQTDSNFGACLTLWDRLFGTLEPAVAPQRLGLDGFDAVRDQTVAGMLATPWRQPGQAASATRP
jgi:sterol desaturase/sphingolipid hydroxylase (fatty acid hydroxylase superfamily)